jgi:hypothetical protein
MIPHVIVLEPGLVIYKIYNGYWFLGRPTLEDLGQDLRAVTRKCRPDWDITTLWCRAFPFIQSFISDVAFMRKTTAGENHT